jgi:hypothetical protein
MFCPAAKNNKESNSLVVVENCLIRKNEKQPADEREREREKKTSYNNYEEVC